MIFNKQGKQIFKETGFDNAQAYEQRLTKALHDVLAN
jgi:hypothetical protein